MLVVAMMAAVPIAAMIIIPIVAIVMAVIIIVMAAIATRAIHQFQVLLIEIESDVFINRS